MTNPLVNSRPSLEGIKSTPSSHDGIPLDVEELLRCYGTSLIQSCGILLKLPQTTIASAMVLFHQFYYVASFRQHALKDSVSASLFLASKLLETSSNPQNIVNVLLTVLDEPLPGLFTQDAQIHIDALYVTEMHILTNLGFRVETKLPYSLAINYLQILGLSSDDRVAQRVWNYCNDMYVPENLAGWTKGSVRTTLVCLHTPPTLACTAIFLTTRDLQIKLPQGWMEVFDVDIQDVVRASARLKIFYYDEPKRVGKHIPVTLTELEEFMRQKRAERVN